jgi:phosphoribosylamine--glycine ligase
VVISAAGYPASPRKGDPITGVDTAAALDDVSVLHAGTALDAEGNLVSAGGRVLAVVALGDDLSDARAKAYQGVEAIHLEGSHHRNDIAAKAAEGKIVL